MPQMSPQSARTSRGPGPSRLGYRLERLWKKSWIRRLGAGVLPALLVGFTGWQVATGPVVSERLRTWKDEAAARLSARAEFAVRGVAVSGASVALAREIEKTVGLTPGMSSLSLDAAALQARIIALRPVKSARVTLTPTGTLMVAVIERTPAALWRDATGRLWRIDREGVIVAAAAARANHPDLPLILGEDAPAAAGEALALLRSAPDLHPRVRAMVRVGERRWDIVLDRGQRLLLPEAGARSALARVADWTADADLLARDVTSVDLRLPDRPTVRMTPEGAKLHRLRRAAMGSAGEDT